MLVTHQATRLVCKTLVFAMLVGSVTTSLFAQDINLNDADFAKKPEPAAKKQLTRGDLVREQLAAGEFGPAMQTAKAAKNPVEQAELVQMVAKAQTDDGDFGAAMNSMKSVPRSALKKKEDEKGLLGGAALADFNTLMNLIREQTRPPALWQQDDGEGGTMSPFPNGVLVEPGGIIRAASKLETAGRLNDLVNRARRADLSAEMAEQTDLRFLSLRRLEEAASQRVAAGLPVLETMRNMGGLVRLRYVMVLPEEQDIIIGGPAEPWRYDETGQPVGEKTGRPTLQLDDLVTVLRTFSQSGSRGFMCSIDPRPEGMKKITEYVTRTNKTGVRNINSYTQTLKKKLGMQDVRLQGIASDSRVARVIVEADYRMKMIGVGKLKGVAGIKSFFDLVPQSQDEAPDSIDALRWWLTMKYDAILHNEDRTAFEFKGSSVLCQSENQLVTEQGKRIATGKAEPINRQFAELFTKHYEQLAARDLAFADLQNVFDLALVAALIFDERLDAQIGWDRGSFATNGSFQTVAYEAPRQVESVVNHKRMKNGEYVIQVAGGVSGDMMSVVKDEEKRVAAEVVPITSVRPAESVPANRWWWNAK
ncbi:MAG: DUF1598 domain-containing protein [Planctomycetaceae bacterium]